MRPMLGAGVASAALAADVKHWALVETIMNRPFVNSDTAWVKPNFGQKAHFFRVAP